MLKILLTFILCCFLLIISIYYFLHLLMQEKYFKPLTGLGLNDKSTYLTQIAHRHEVENMIKNMNRFQ